MSETPRRRGRPKGTGIDDSRALETIAGLLASNANLRPTTAIRQAGVTDPSVVRRLREKLKVVPPASSQQFIAAAPARAYARLEPQGPAPTPPTTVSIPPAPSANLLAANQRRSTKTSPKPFGQPAASLPPKSPAKQDTPAESSRPPNPGSEAADLGEPPPTPGTQPPPHAQPPDPQLEAMRLAGEAAAAMSRLYLHCLNNAALMSPLGLALNTQATMSQWFSGLMAGQIAAQRKRDS